MVVTEERSGMGPPVVELLTRIEQRQEGIERRLDAIQLKIETLTAPPKAVTIENAAQILSRSVTTVKGMIRRGEIGTCMIAKTRMVPMHELVRKTSMTSIPLSAASGPVSKRERLRAKRKAADHASAIRRLAKKRD
jgi:hypothetical protein